MFEVRLRVELHIAGPFTTKGAAAGAFGVDAPLLRDRDGRPVLPGTQVRGRVRDALEELESVAAGADVGAWFGPTVDLDDPTPEVGPRRFGWVFSDFVARGDEFRSNDPYQRLLTRIRVDPDAGAVAGGAMLVAETAAEPGRSIPFTGTVDLSADTADGLAGAVEWLHRGLCWASAFGAYRGVGFGRLRRVRLAPDRLVAWAGGGDDARAAVAGTIRRVAGEPPAGWADAAPGRSATGPPAGDRMGLTLTPLEPFCAGGRRTGRNLLTTLDHMSGAVVKGAVAVQLGRVLGLAPRVDLAAAADRSSWPELCRHFSAVRFLAAFPCRDDRPTRPVVPPLSLVKVKGRTNCLDVALCERPFLIRGEAPAFGPDWKGNDTPGFADGPAVPDREVRMHTAIDPEHRRVRTEHLFGHEVVHPGGLVWRGAVDVSGIEPATDRPKVVAQLADFLTRATLRVGKTKAETRATIAPATAPVARDPLPGGVWILTLQSSALMADPFALAASWPEPGPDPLRGEYGTYFHAVSGGAVKLVRFFAAQDLQGGYLSARGGRAYNPYLVTTAGSVFVLAATGDGSRARDVICGWERTGLPLPAWAAARYGTAFTTNPLLPQDGFGEVAVNLPCHTALKPKADEVEEVVAP